MTFVIRPTLAPEECPYLEGARPRCRLLIRFGRREGRLHLVKIFLAVQSLVLFCFIVFLFDLSESDVLLLPMPYVLVSWRTSHYLRRLECLGVRRQ